MKMQSARIELGQKTDPGRDPDKQVNEDTILAFDTSLGPLCVVCDGMGGHASGQEASRLAVKTIVDKVLAAGEDAPPGATLREAVREANAAVYAMPKSEAGGRPGSTAVAILVHKGGTEIAHVGDSRCYLVHQGAIAQVTKDHSKVQLLVDAGYLKPEEAKTHPDANQIIRALGMTPDVDVELRPEPVHHVAGDVFVLCSDGLSDLVEPEEILQAVSSAPSQQAAGQLVDLANARGGHDNISVLVVRLKESATPSARLDAPTVTATAPGTEILPTPQNQPAVAAAGTTTGPLPVVAPRAAKTEMEVPVFGQGAQERPPTPPDGPGVGQLPPVIPVAPPPPASAPARSRTSGLVVFGLALAVVALLVLGLFVYSMRARSTRQMPLLVPSGGPTTSATEHLVADEEGGVPAPLATSAEPLPTAAPSASGRRK
jgi:protein phosphatase